MNSPAPQRTWEGRMVGSFRLGPMLGSSEHSSVFSTELTPGGRKAAIKLVPAAKVDPKGQLELWNAAKQLAHPHLLKVFESGTCELDGVPLLFVVVELADDELSQVLPQRALTSEEAKEFLKPALDALAYLHEKGFAHGSVKPSNIQAAENQLRLSCDRLRRIGQKGVRVPFPSPYDAPETSDGEVTAAADFWGLGVTVVESLTQRLPRIEANGPVVPDSLPEPFRGIARSCLQIEPARRGTIQEIRDRLAGKPMSPVVTPPPPAPSETPREEPAKGSRRIFAGIAAICAVVAVIAYGALRHREPESTPVPTSQPQASAPITPAPTPPSVKASNTAGEIVHQVIPDVPRSARNTIHGRIKVVVRVKVDPSGKVTSAALTTPGPSQYFANLAERAAQRWEFSPTLVDGKAAASTWSIRFQFSRSSTQAFPSKVRQ